MAVGCRSTQQGNEAPQVSGSANQMRGHIDEASLHGLFDGYGDTDRDMVCREQNGHPVVESNETRQFGDGADSSNRLEGGPERFQEITDAPADEGRGEAR